MKSIKHSISATVNKSKSHKPHIQTQTKSNKTLIFKNKKEKTYARIHFPLRSGSASVGAGVGFLASN